MATKVGNAKDQASVPNKLPFKVSARAALLIGRENVATSQGAVTELVKNAYDADAHACAILFLRKYENIPEKLSIDDYEDILARTALVEECYDKKNVGYELSKSVTDDVLQKLNSELDNIVDLWIIDNGNGMSAETIETRWMVIGTNSKEVGVVSSGGRVFTGAKGIGRFALDRLGRQCELFSGEENHAEIVHWYVDWGEFEGEGKIIDDVTAVLEKERTNLPALYAKAGISQILPTEIQEADESSTLVEFKKGTALKISNLNDAWDHRDSTKLRGSLEALLPPKDQRDFAIYVYDHRDVPNSGWIDNLLPEQFDYRLKAIVGDDGQVLITINRQEIDIKRIPADVFSLPAMQQTNYSIQDFERGSITYTKSLSNILRKSDLETSEYLKIGPFEFTLYFMKLKNPLKDAIERYYQKNFDALKRRRWLKTSGGIRLYRDQFRVRPYGEPNTQAADWLLLGQRVAQNPAQASRIGWRVPPQQVAGTINISKARNPLLADQSNREGIMNERAFSAFREIILGLIKEFESDRSYIYQQFDIAYKKRHPDEEDIAKGKEKAEEILRKKEKKKEDNSSASSNENAQGNSENSAEGDAEEVAKALSLSVKRNDELEDEIQVLRGMATLGTVLVSFTHELKQIQANMETRHKRLKNAILKVIDESKLKSLVEKDTRYDPLDILSRIEREDAKVSKWVDFALASVSQNKRRRKVVQVSSYFDSLKKYWGPYLEDRNISLTVQVEDFMNSKLIAHEIDLDSVFYNLIVNSVEAATQPVANNDRKIWIECAGISDDYISIIYRDNGPGIPKNFNTAEDIFLYGSSSKAGVGNDDIAGTGIGMWLVKSIIDDFGGDVSLQCEMGKPNFGLLLQLPLHKNKE